MRCGTGVLLRAGIDMQMLDERLSTEIIRDFRRAGYSYFRLPKELVREAESLASLLYDLDISQRVRRAGYGRVRSSRLLSFRDRSL